MNIYLIRHGIAEETKENKPHEERELTIEGIESLKNSIEYWKEYIQNFDLILSSPLKRSMQTAQIIKNSFNVSYNVVEEISLMNGGLTEDLLSLIISLDLNEVAMVGHQPDIGIHSARLTNSSETNIKILPASILKISFSDKPVMGKGILEFLLPPINKKG